MIKSTIHHWMLSALERRGTRYVPFWRYRERVCPICGYNGRFDPFGIYFVRPDARCRNCGSWERQRQLKLFLDAHPEMITETMDVLHFAPEENVTRFVRPKARSYVTADLYYEKADHAWDIESIDCADGSFDAIICLHVLEHVDTEKALSEFHRVLRPGGRAFIMVPICEGLDTTYTNDSIQGDMDRWSHFQQQDHTRIFGRDFREMIRQADFDLAEHVAYGQEAVDYGLVMGERIFIATRGDR